jgi:hypothetical protein
MLSIVGNSVRATGGKQFSLEPAYALPGNQNARNSQGRSNRQERIAYRLVGQLVGKFYPAGKTKARSIGAIFARCGWADSACNGRSS